MAKQEQMDAMLARLDEATNEIADDMRKLRDELAAGNVSDASLEALDSAISKLESMGKEDGEPEDEQPA